MVLNRPTPVDVHDVLEPWAGLAGAPPVVFQGGPVSLDSALALAVVPGDHRDERSGPLGWRRVHGAIGLVDLEAPPEVLAIADAVTGSVAEDGVVAELDRWFAPADVAPR